VNVQWTYSEQQLSPGRGCCCCTAHSGNKVAQFTSLQDGKGAGQPLSVTTFRQDCTSAAWVVVEEKEGAVGRNAKISMVVVLVLRIERSTSAQGVVAKAEAAE